MNFFFVRKYNNNNKLYIFIISIINMQNNKNIPKINITKIDRISWSKLPQEIRLIVIFKMKYLHDKQIINLILKRKIKWKSENDRVLLVSPQIYVNRTKKKSFKIKPCTNLNENVHSSYCLEMFRRIRVFMSF